eukprot:CAMPEP_0185698826 /NCGR_PEP_ID=MMETSP1164-20130828/6557_1 /TAXON_ID=1104430 /ORGANISM="Chrysoreinhardia sp, Strain CCMP2950" /LENGTH=259 /DNA_ID=CAMNT_0028365751 /DNA_START=33 /DNA_END=808 /DNA_ORIENTATION=-
MAYSAPRTQALGQAQRQIAGSKDAERMRLLDERNEHLSAQLEALRDALRGGHPTRRPPQMKHDHHEAKQTKDGGPREEEAPRHRKKCPGEVPEETVVSPERAKIALLETELREARTAHGADVDALVSRLGVAQEALADAKEELRRATSRAAELEATLATTREAAALDETKHVLSSEKDLVRCSVPRDAVPGVSSVLVTLGTDSFCENDDDAATEAAGTTVATTVPTDASPGGACELRRRDVERAIECQQRRDLSERLDA